MRLRVCCPECQAWTRTDDVGVAAWRCARCGFMIPAESPSSAKELTACRRCGNTELYVQKDFPQWLGMTIIVVACLASVVTYANNWIVATWAILIGSAVLDVILYLVMGSVTTCYRCHAQHRGFPPNPEHNPFDLARGERYRQERLRRQQLER